MLGQSPEVEEALKELGGFGGAALTVTTSYCGCRSVPSIVCNVTVLLLHLTVKFVLVYRIRVKALEIFEHLYCYPVITGWVLFSGS